MKRTKVFELHRALASSSDADFDTFGTRPNNKGPVEPSLAISRDDGCVFARCQPETGSFERVDVRRDADLVLRVATDELSDRLALLTVRDDLLVNGVRALAFTSLTLRDSLTLPGPAGLYYVTARFKPHAGPPTPQMLGQKCPFCRIAIKPDTYVVSCRCGAVYHAESQSTHPHLTAEDQLNCVERVAQCLSCGHEVTREEVLMWDPEAM